MCVRVTVFEDNNCRRLRRKFTIVIINRKKHEERYQIGIDSHTTGLRVG
jgi:hypothetical protein